MQACQLTPLRAGASTSFIAPFLLVAYLWLLGRRVVHRHLLSLVVIVQDLDDPAAVTGLAAGGGRSRGRARG